MGILDFLARRGGPISRRFGGGGKVSADEDLFDDEFQRKLETLAVVSKRVFSGAMRAERRTRKTGSGVEFADHRDYVPGDDFRYLDWHVWERMGRLLIRLYEEEEDLSIYFILDASASMGFGDGEKLRHAKRLVAALAYVGLANLDRVTIVGANDAIEGRMPETRGKSRIFRVFRFLNGIRPTGETDLESALRTFAAQHKRRGLAVLVSDLYDPKGFEKGINALRFAKFEPFVLHVVDEHDRNPELRGDVRVYDCESGDEREVTVTPRLLEKYAKAYDDWLSSVGRYCASKQVDYFRADVQIPFDELILRVFRKGGFLPVTFAGLPFATLLGAFAAFGAAVVLLYILKLKRRPVAVPFSRIWERILRDKEATSLFSQLKRLLSLLLQLALLALLIGALGDPRTAANLVEGRNLVVLIDASASMQATDVQPSRLESGKKKVIELLRGLGGSDRMLIAQMDAGTTPLSTLTGDVAELEAAVMKVEPTEARADLPRGLRFAADALRGLPKSEIVVVSDGVLGEARDQFGAVDLGGAKLSYVPLGERGRNAAITGFSVRRYPLDKSRYEVMLEVTNASADPLDIELSLWGDGQVTDVQRLRLGANEKLPRFYPNLSGASRTLEARLALADGGHDDLPADDKAYALLPERRRAKVQVVTPGNMYLEAALLLDEYLEVTTVAPARYPAEGTFDVTIFDAVAPKVTPGSGSLLYLGPTGGELPFELDKAIKDDDPERPLGFDDIDEKHPLVRWANLTDINIALAQPIKPAKEDRVVGKSFRGPLLVEGRRDGKKFVALGFDVRSSDFPLRIAWPLFLLGAIDLFVEEDTSYISSFATGEVWRIPAPSDATTATLKAPSGAQIPIPVDEGRAVFLGRRSGFYELETGPEGARVSSGFAANLVDPTESDVEPIKELKVGDVIAGEVTGFTVGVRREMWGYLLAIVVAISAIEWLLYHRRVTV